MFDLALLLVVVFAPIAILYAFLTRNVERRRKSDGTGYDNDGGDLSDGDCGGGEGGD